MVLCSKGEPLTFWMTQKLPVSSSSSALLRSINTSWELVGILRKATRMVGSSIG